jgi:hypothetical protein
MIATATHHEDPAPDPARQRLLEERELLSDNIVATTEALRAIDTAIFYREHLGRHYAEEQP